MSRWRGAVAAALASVGVLASGGVGRGLPIKSAASGTPQNDSGISGEVVIGPTCPVARPGKLCERPYRATLTIRRETGGPLVTRVRSSSDGRFRISLAPGRYLVLPHNGHPYPRSSPEVATVYSHRYTTVLVRYESGIR